MDEQDRKAMIRQTFNTVAEGYDNRALRYFADSAHHLADVLDLKGDERVLDVATGTGSNALVLAQHLPEGRVTGIDFSSGMLSQARAKAEKAAIHNINFLEMDMQQLAFPDDHFDAASCAFGIFFVEDMVGQLKHIASKVKKGGRVGITSFYDNAFQPLAELFFSRIEQYGIERPAVSWKRVSTEEKSAALYASANLGDVQVIRKNLGYYLRSADGWWDVIWYAGFRGLVNQLAPQDLERFKQEHLHEIQSLSTSEGIWLDVEVLYTVGTRL
jgi:ubiquinone/menaquinone biosynthesis C-methylase UbiE